MNRKIKLLVFTILISIMFISATAIASEKSIIDAKKNNVTVLIDGINTEFEVYEIEGNNYFKLRDLGEQMNFEVLWNESNKLIEINSNSKYLDKDIKNLNNDIKPWDYVRILGVGMDVDWLKTSKGRQFYNNKSVKDFKDAGVSHVRIRIADEMTDELLILLDQVLKDCFENKIIPIIAYQADDFKNNPNEKNMKNVINWWSIVAKRYKDESKLLSFDLLIEATDILNKDPEKLNEIYENLVKEIRVTNPNRIIMISPRLRSDAQYLKELKIPTDHNGYLMAQWHFYASGPSKTKERKLWTTGTDFEKQLIDDKINQALLWQRENNIPTWVGAWMPSNYNDGNEYSIDEQLNFANYMTLQLNEANIPFAVNSDTKYYNRENNQWIEDRVKIFNAIFKSK